ncbi:MAG: leucyl aminopeptidase family protein [Salibacteraceae bacterium]
MQEIFTSSAQADPTSNQVILFNSINDVKSLSDQELSFATDQLNKKNNSIHINRMGQHVFLYQVEKQSDENLTLEKARLAAHGICKTINGLKLSAITISGSASEDLTIAFAEGLGLSNYQFLKYFSDAEKRKNSLSKIEIVGCSEKSILELNAVTSGTCLARSFVNEPLSYLTAEQYAHDIMDLGEELGFSVDVFNKSKIQALKMGGLLAVNLGSPNPPTFSIMEWKPENAKNAKPYVLVGKGVVYDTGGVSLKPTANSMDYMKCDMGGSAAVVGAMAAITQANLPVHVIGLVPATDNRPGGNAYVPGDVINMHNGMTVEVLNTDAEGRMILADALSYARQYDPELVIDLATLTGAAARAIGDKAIVSMGNLSQDVHDKMIESGFRTYERLAQFPFWDDYNDDLKSRVADLKNLGGPEAGMITAGKFLEHFTRDTETKEGYPYLHLDIAGPAFNHSEKNYRGIEGTGVGVRTLFDFFKNL